MQRILCFWRFQHVRLSAGRRAAHGRADALAMPAWNAKLHCQVLEEGVCGRVAFYHDGGPQEQTLRALKRALVRHAPIDGIVLMLGTNDLP